MLNSQETAIRDLLKGETVRSMARNHSKKEVGERKEQRLFVMDVLYLKRPQNEVLILDEHGDVWSLDWSTTKIIDT